MPRTLAKIALVGICALGIFSGFAGQDRPGAPVYRTGLIPLTDEEFAEIRRTRPQVTKVDVNWLGFERINEVRKGKGKAGLDPASVRPVGREVESAVFEAGAVVQAYTGNAEIAADLPVAVDNSKLKYFPPIRSQSPLGSCAAFSTTYYQFSYMAAFQRDLDIRDPGDNTNKYSPKWTYNMVNGGADNGSSFNSVYPVLEKHGAATWAEFPYDGNYTAWCIVPSVWRNALYVRSSPAQIVFQASSESGLAYIRELLTNGYVLVFGTYITSWQFTTIPDDPATADDAAAVGKEVGYWLNGDDGSHAMTVVGFNDAIWTDINGNGMVDPGEKGAFRIANSWGPGWKDGGFTWLAYDALKTVSAVSGGPSAGREQAFQSNIVWVQAARDAYSPLMIGEFTLNHLKRNQLKLTVGRSATTSTTPTTSWTPAALQNQGSSYAFDGTTTAVDAGFVLDYSDILVEGAGTLRYHLGIHDNFLADPGTLRAFKLVDLTTSPATETVYASVPQTLDNQQVYAYVDYNYTGPSYDHPPVLSNPQVSPGVGTAVDTFGYMVYYSDQDGDAPSVMDVVIDDNPYAMSLMSGSASNGWYHRDTTLALGNHIYYFSFKDSRGGSARAPLAGALQGPNVYAIILSSLSPSSATAGGPAFTLSVTGSTFANGAVVRWDGSDRPTTFVSGSLVTAAIPASDLAAGKVVVVTVRNPDGGLSSPLNFTVNNTVPALSSLSPARASRGGSGLTLTVAGSGFVPGAVVRWDSVAKTTTFVSPTQLQAQITSVDIGASGDHNVTVQNPPPGGGESGTIVFPVSGFTVASSTASATVTAGQSASYTIRVTPQSGPFDSPVTLSCPTLARGVTASFSPASVTPGVAEATSQLTLTTTARQSSGAGSTFASSGAGPFGTGLLLLAASALLVLAAARLGLPRRLVPRSAAAVAALGLIALIAACSSDGGGGPTNTGTPAGTYQVGVRGASGGMIISTTVELVVR
jgi:hypothetical protein